MCVEIATKFHAIERAQCAELPLRSRNSFLYVLFNVIEASKGARDLSESVEVHLCNGGRIGARSVDASQHAEALNARQFSNVLRLLNTALRDLLQQVDKFSSQSRLVASGSSTHEAF